MTPGLLLVAARQAPEALFPIGLIAVALFFVFRRPLSRLWSVSSARRPLVLVVVSAFAVAAILEILRPTDGPFMAFALFVALPVTAVLVLILSHLQKRAWPA